MKKRVVKGTNERHIQIKQAHSKKPTTPYLNSHGMNPKQMRKALLGPPKKPVVSRHLRPIGRERPLKVHKSTHKLHGTATLVEVPNAGTKQSIEYPVPKWFKYSGSPKVSVIVPIYKSQGVLADLIDSWPLEDDVEIIFVDDHCPNNSKDAVVKLWGKRLSELKNGVGKIIFNIENKGYGTACNVGAEHASGEYIIFLNADTKVTPGWIDPIIELLQDKTVGIVGNMQIKEGGMWDNTIDSAGSEWTWAASSFVHIGRHSYKKQNIPMPYTLENAPADICTVAEREMVTGCCLAMRKDLYEYVGGYNPNYRIGYWEDAEICMTVRELGYKVLFQPKSVIYHKLSHTNSGGHEFQDFNRSFFFNKWVSSYRIDKLVADKRETSPNVGTVLLKRSGANGDVLVASAVAPAIKKMYPGCKITFCTNCKDVLANNPYIDKIIDSSDLHERAFQVYYNFDMIYEYRPNTNILDAYAEAVGAVRENCKLYLHKEALYQQLPKEYIVVHAGKTMWVGRDWKSDNFAEISQKLMASGEKVVCIGKESETAIPCTVDLRGKTTINQLATVISRAKMFIGIDSFPMHVAQVFNVPGHCFFGSILPETRIYSDKMKSITADGLGCLGCHHRKPTPCTVTNNCETGTLDCINLVTIDYMWKSIGIDHNNSI